MVTSFVSPSSPSGNDRRLELAGVDLWINGQISHVFVYPSDLNIDRMKEALSDALSLWPLVAGRFLLLNNGHYVIEMSDNPIPFTFIENTDLSKWPHSSNVVLDMNQISLKPFLDEIDVTKLMGGSKDEPLFRLKLTHMVQNNEWIMGISWSHILSDAAACLHFLNSVSQLYQQMELPKPTPIFERRLWHKNPIDSSLLPMMKYLQDGQTREQTIQRVIVDQSTHDQINMCFSGEQLTRLRTIVDETNVTYQDALTAYIILTLNTHCFENDEQYIERTNMIVNIRGVSDKISPHGHVANAVMSMRSDPFGDPKSLSSIAMTIRRSIIRARDPTFLESWFSTADNLMRKMVANNLVPNTRPPQGEIIVNSYLRYDWADLVDFGYSNKCRFYATRADVSYIRVFRLNPVHDGTKWMKRDLQGAEVVFRIDNTIKEKFLNAWKQDVDENFINVKK
ncbi:unnamed protein product [Rotaria sp. Silwood2]|nr:unnamed protein product [Rotaria sp. Silwood2]